MDLIFAGYFKQKIIKRAWLAFSLRFNYYIQYMFMLFLSNEFAFNPAVFFSYKYLIGM